MVQLLSIPHVLLMVLCLAPTSVYSNFLREGFSSSMGNDFKQEMKLEESEMGNGMTREMFLMKEVEWELQPMDFSKVEDSGLRRHVQSYFNGPVKVKLSSRQGKYGLRAMGQLESGKRLRAFWRQSMVTGSNQSTDFLKMSYDDAVQNRLGGLELEVQLPPMSKKKKGLPTVVFTVAVEPGTMNAKAVLPRGPASIKILPEGRDGAKEAVVIPSSESGMSFMTVPMKSGLIDHGWAKGRAIFRKGRPL